MTADSPAWEEWFELQYGLCREVSQLLEQALRGQPKTMRAAVTSAVLEHLAEHIRGDLELPNPKAQATKEA